MGWLPGVFGRRRAEAPRDPEEDEAAVRRAFEAEAWPLMPDVCPCDTEFVAWLAGRGLAGKRIFHFGSGLHHVVGRDNWERGNPNEVLAVTSAPEEHRSYVEFVLAEPGAALGYKLVFTDVYAWSPALARGFDVVTLFHLGEFHSDVQRSYGALDDAGLLDLFVEGLRPGRLVLAYTRSLGFPAAGPLFLAQVAAGRLSPVEDHGSLRVFARTETPVSLP